MLVGSSIFELGDVLDIRTLRVHSPSVFILACGGKFDVTKPASMSLRDSFLTSAPTSPLYRYETKIPEDFVREYTESNYNDLLEFEKDLAQLCDLVLLFSESYGSVAELGSFAMLEEIAERLLVVIDDKNFGNGSFIDHGPIKALINRYGRQAICVVPLMQIGIESISQLKNLDQNELMRIVGSAAETRIESIAKQVTRSTFDSKKIGHQIRLMVGLVQYYGALTPEEIQLHLESLSVHCSESTLKKHLVCANCAGWIKRSPSGSEDFFVPAHSNEAIQFQPKQNIEFEKLDWRARVREHYRKTDPSRFHCIQSAMEDFNQ